MWDLRLTFRGMWFRRGVSSAVFVVAALVVGGAVTGPLFSRAAAESVLDDTLGQALPIGRVVNDHAPAPLAQAPLTRVERVSSRKLDQSPVLQRLLTAPVASLQVQAVVSRPGAGGDSAMLAYRQGVCRHVRVAAGRCPRDQGTVMVSAKTAAALGWHVGEHLVVNERPVTVAGLYVPVQPQGDYWGTQDYFPVSLGQAADQDGTVDALFAPLSTVRAQPGSLVAVGALDRRLRVSRLHVKDVPALQRALVDYASQGSSWNLDPNADITDTALGSVLTQARQINAKLLVPVVVVEVQLLVLCWLILFLVVANAAEARGQEVALAKLRGVPPAATVALALLDTLLLVALAVPAGLGLAWAWVTGIAHLQLAPGTPVVLTPACGWAAAGAGLGAVVAAGLATSRTLRRPVLEQWRRATRSTRARPWPVDAVVVAASVVSLVVLARHGAVGAGATTVLALMTPGLVVLAAALIGSRVLPGLCRAAFGSTRRRGRLAGFLAVRQLARRPTTLRLALVLVMAFGLMTFGIDAWTVTRGNQHDRAWTEVGAAEVLTVEAPAGKDLGTIVDALDPSGRRAAAVEELTDYSRPTRIQVLAVQPDRFAHVAFWRSDLGPAPLPTLMRRLTRPVAPSVRLTGDALAVHLTLSRLAARRPPVLVADIAQQGAGPGQVTLGRLHPGRQVLEADLPCDTVTCSLVGLHLDRPLGRFFPFSAHLSVTGVRVRGGAGWRSVEAGLSSAGSWRSGGRGSRVLPAGGDHGLRLAAHVGSTAVPAWQVADVPRALPALVTGPAQAVAGGHIEGFDTAQMPIDPVAVGPALPGAGAAGVVLDRRYAIREAYGATLATTETVWLAPSAVATYPRLLRKAGVSILGTSSAGQRTALYHRQGPALAILLFLAGAALGAVLAAGGVVLNLHLAGRRRTYELAAMLALGVRRRVLLRSMFGEQALLLCFGIATGVASGVLGAFLALPAVPEFADTPEAPPMHYGIAWAPVLGVSCAAAVVVAVVIALSAASLLRGSRFTQLREAQA